MARYPGPAQLRDTPATDIEIYKIKRARKTGKVKNPPWYKVPKLPESFKPDLRQYIRPSCRYGPGHTWDCDTWTGFNPKVEINTTAEYVAAYEAARHLITPERAREIAAEQKERKLAERNAVLAQKQREQVRKRAVKAGKKLLGQQVELT